MTMKAKKKKNKVSTNAIKTKMISFDVSVVYCMIYFFKVL